MKFIVIIAVYLSLKQSETSLEYR